MWNLITGRKPVLLVRNLLSIFVFFGLPLGFAPLPKSAPAKPALLPTCNIGCNSIPGSPVTIIAGKDASYQVTFKNALGSFNQVYQPLFDEGDAGLFVRYNNYIIGPDFWSHLTTAANAYDVWTSAGQSSVTGNGTVSTPWTLDTKVEHKPSGVTLTARTSYVNGNNSFRIDWDICLPQAGSISAYLAADFYLQGGDSDPSYGVRDSSSGAVGASNTTHTWLETFTPVTTASRYFAGAPSSLWAAIGIQGAPGRGFDNLLNSNPIDTGAGLQWDRSFSGCTHLTALWNVTGSSTITDFPYKTFMPQIFH